MPPRRSRASAAAALAACFVLFSSLISSSVAEHIEFDVWHRLGSDASSKWTPAGTLSGEVDTEALVDAAAAALRGGGGRIPPPPKSSSPVLTLYRDEKNAITFEEAKRAADRGQGYSIKLKRKLADDRSKKNKKATTKGSTLFTSAPPHCAAAALSGALPLKLDGSLPKSSSGGAGIRVTGVSFDFYGGACSKGNYKRGTKQQQQQLQAQQQQQQQRVPLWLPAAAPPLLPPPPPPAAAKKAAAAAALAQAQAEAARRRAAGGGGGGDGDGEADGQPAPPPAEDNRTWLQKNWVYALPMFMMVMNGMNAAAGPPPPPQQQRRPGAGAGAAAAAGAVAAGAAAASAGNAGGGGGGGVGGVASLD